MVLARRSPWVVAEPEVAPDDVLQQSDRTGLLDAADHVAEYGSDCVEALICLADVSEADIVEEDLLYNEDGHSLAELGARLHDAKAEGDDLRRKKECDDLRVVRLLDQRADDTQRGEPKVFEWPGLGRGVQERVQEQGYVCCEEVAAGSVSKSMYASVRDSTDCDVRVCAAAHLARRALWFPGDWRRTAVEQVHCIHGCLRAQ